MKLNIHTRIRALSILLFLVFSGWMIPTAHAQVFCNSTLTLDSANCDVSGNYHVYLQLCVGGGFGGGNGFTGDIFLAVSGANSPLISSFTPSITSDSLGATLAGANMGAQPSFNASSSVLYSGSGATYTCVNSILSCGQPHQDCQNIELVLNEWPDSIRAFGVESGGSLTSTATCNYTAQTRVDFTNLAPFRADAGPDFLDCSGAVVQIGTPTGVVSQGCDSTIYSYSWSPGTNLSSTSVPNPFCMITGGLQYVLTVTDTSGNVFTDTMRVDVQTTPPVIGFPDTSRFCGFPALLSGPSGPYVYTWSSGQTTQTISLGFSTTYYLTVTDFCGLVGIDSTYAAISSMTQPSFPNDTISCTDTLVMTAPAGAAQYLWSNGDTVASTSITTPGTYAVTVSEVLGCQYADTFFAAFDTACVWPGDINYDYVVDLNDPLLLAVNFGNFGLPRPLGDTTWRAQPGIDWASTMSNGYNQKHADCNGDGAVDTLDMPTITANYGFVHTKTTGGLDTASFEILLNPVQDTLLEGDTLFVGVLLGTPANPADSILGVGFELHFDTSIVAQAQFYTNYDSCWLGTQGTNLLPFEKELYADGRLDIAVAANDHIERSGHGQICGIGLVMQDDIAGKVHTLHKLGLTILNPRIIRNSEVFTALRPTTDTVVVNAQETRVSPPSKMNFTVFPNPADRLVEVQWLAGTPAQITLRDLRGRVMQHVPARNSGNASFRVGDLPRGMYLIEIASPKGTFRQVKKIVLQ